MAKRKFELQGENSKNIIDMKTGKSSEKKSMPVICRCIRYYREKSGMDQKALANAVGVLISAVSNWENGRSRPDINLLPKICKALDITFYDLFDMQNPTMINTPREQNLIDSYEQLSAGHQHTIDKMIETLIKVELAENCPDLRMLLYFNRSLAAGIGDPTEFEDEAEPVYVYTTPEIAHADSIFKINGDSMEPRFHNGQDVLVQRISGSSDLKYGEIGAFIIGNETYIKQYEKDGLHSLNPDYPVMHFEDEDAVYLIGRVLGVLEPEGYAKQSDIDRYKLIHSEEI